MFNAVWSSHLSGATLNKAHTLNRETLKDTRYYVAVYRTGAPGQTDTERFCICEKNTDRIIKDDITLDQIDVELKNIH